MRRAFTLMELMVAVGILALVLSFAGIVFNVSIEAHRMAIANAEIMQKLRAITAQLDADFQGLRKDAEIFVAWVAADRRSLPPEDTNDCDLDGFERFDRIVFFADGDFQSYGSAPPVRGNLARVSYMLARNGPAKAESMPRHKRVLARTQHIITADPALPAGLLDPADPNALTDPQWHDWHSGYEYEKITPEQWKHIDKGGKANMLTAITDVNVFTPTVGLAVRGADIDTANPASIHMLLCEGVGEFKVQGWYDLERRWLPEVDPDGDGDLSDSDFYLDPADPTSLAPDRVPGVLYPYRRSVPRPYGGVAINGLSYPPVMVNEANFSRIPGLGRALKFTFTLFDSKGIIKQGRTFSHIVYLDK